jgi:hypothetical protein
MGRIGPDLSAALAGDAEQDTNFIEHADGSKQRIDAPGVTITRGGGSISVRMPGESSSEVMIDGVSTPEEAHDRNAFDTLVRRNDEAVDRILRFSELDEEGNPIGPKPGYEKEVSDALMALDQFDAEVELHELMKTKIAGEAAAAQGRKDADFAARAAEVDRRNEAAYLKDAAPAVTAKSYGRPRKIRG